MPSSTASAGGGLLPPPAARASLVDYEAILRLFRDDMSAELVDRQVAALVLVTRENANGCVLRRAAAPRRSARRAAPPAAPRRNVRSPQPPHPSHPRPLHRVALRSRTWATRATF